MTGLTPPAGVEARRPLEGCAAEWHVPGPDGTFLRFRLWPPREARTNRAGHEVSPGRPPYVEIRTGHISFGPDISDPDDLRRFAWLVLQSCHRLAHALEVGEGPAAELELDPQTTVDDFVDGVIEVRT